MIAPFVESLRSATSSEPVRARFRLRRNSSRKWSSFDASTTTPSRFPASGHSALDWSDQESVQDRSGIPGAREDSPACVVAFSDPQAFQAPREIIAVDPWSSPAIDSPGTVPATIPEDLRNVFLVHSIRGLASDGQEFEAGVAVHLRLDDLLHAGDFPHCNHFLSLFDPERDDLDVLIALLMGTSQLGDRLSARRRLFEVARRRLREAEPRDADATINRFEN